MRQVIVYPDEDGFWVAEVPSLPGSNSQGESREVVLENIRDAIEGYIGILMQEGLPVPEEKREVITLDVA